ncbi:MAG: hypothetical protein ACK2UM_13315, partial [Anaerolineales bacterium]
DNATGQVSSVTLGLGEDVTCTFVNDDDAPALYLAKHVVNDNGGEAVASAWTLSAGSNDVTGSEGGVLATDQVGTYALSETSVSGYTNTSITCDDAPGVEVTSVTIGLGDTKTCTFVNDDDKAQPSGTTVQSWVLHDTLSMTGIRHGEGEEVSSVTFSLYSDSSCSVSSFVGSETGVSAGVDVWSTSVGIAVPVDIDGVPQDGDYYWMISYSGNNLNNPFETQCGYEITHIEALDEVHDSYVPQ